VFHPPAAGDIKPPEWQLDLPFLTVGAASTTAQYDLPTAPD